MTQVAVYGSLRKGMGNHGILEGAAFIGRTTTADVYTMYSLGGFPRVALDGAMSKIVVEIYDCNDDQMARLDRLEGYRGEGHSNFYDRSSVDLDEYGTALMYHIDGEGNSNDLVPDGDWVNYVQHRAKRYS